MIKQGQAVTFNGEHHQVSKGSKLIIEGLWAVVTGKSWYESFEEGNPAAIIYGVRHMMHGLPQGDAVYYTHDQWGLGHLVHESEVEICT